MAEAFTTEYGCEGLVGEILPACLLRMMVSGKERRPRGCEGKDTWMTLLKGEVPAGVWEKGSTSLWRNSG